MEEICEVRRVLKRTDGVKYLIIPKKSVIKAGELVTISKLNQMEVKNGK